MYSWLYTFFSFSIMNISCHSLLAYQVSVDRAAENLVCLPLQVHDFVFPLLLQFSIKRGAQSLKFQAPSLEALWQGRRVNPQEQAAQTEGPMHHRGRSGSPVWNAFRRGKMAILQGKVLVDLRELLHKKILEKKLSAECSKARYILCVVIYRKLQVVLSHEHLLGQIGARSLFSKSLHSEDQHGSSLWGVGVSEMQGFQTQLDLRQNSGRSCYLAGGQLRHTDKGKVGADGRLSQSDCSESLSDQNQRVIDQRKTNTSKTSKSQLTFYVNMSFHLITSSFFICVTLNGITLFLVLDVVKNIRKLQCTLEENAEVYLLSLSH